ncbi:hypothetical protein ACHAWO_007250 [Cyclotella atomus]|uniref:Uncharacterized protein n=1 Tax=Cyclotella atomus TaxID=382360 RepID=A0ABD3NLF9_9STRA
MNIKLFKKVFGIHFGPQGHEPTDERTSFVTTSQSGADLSAESFPKREEQKSYKMPSIKKIIVGTTSLAVVAAIGIVTWRYGPWQNTSKSSNGISTSNLLSNSTCETCCNGLESNCNLAVNDVLFPAVHNAHSSYEDNFIGASNNLPFEDALVAGYRAIQLNSCACEGGGLLSNFLLEQDEEWGLAGSNLGFCNSYCGKGVRDPKEVLTSIKSFLDKNVREVLMVQLSVEGDSLDDFKVALGHSGLEKYIYQPTEKYVDWPTMGSLIQNDTRLLLFANGEGMRSCFAEDCESGILYTPDHFAFTTDYDITSCEASVTGDNLAEFLAMNHYETNQINWPSEKNARELNSFSALQKRFEGCKGRKMPSVLVVDFWDVGDVVDFVMEENKSRGGVDSKLDQDYSSNKAAVERNGNVRG